jgi:hypothetical protein
MKNTKSILQQIIETPDNKLRDDDHLERPDVTKSEAKDAFKELKGLLEKRSKKNKPFS